jgi:hypothetical protein
MRREPSALGYNWATRSFGIYIQEPAWPSRLGESRIWDRIIRNESHGTRTGKWLRWQTSSETVNEWPALSSQKAPNINEPDGASHRDELNGPPSAITLNLTLSCSCKKWVARGWGRCQFGNQRNGNVRSCKPIPSNDQWGDMRAAATAIFRETKWDCYTYL